LRVPGNHPNCFLGWNCSERSEGGIRKASVGGPYLLGELDDTSGVDRVVVIKKDLTQSANVSLTLTGKTHNGIVKFLAASSVAVKNGVTHGGQRLDTSPDGTCQGIQSVRTGIPGGSAGNVYTFPIPTASAALLTVN
jgi:hypothetical protein